MIYKCCHLTSVHSRFDIRIYQKECRSLTQKYDVFLIVADGLGDEIKDGVSIIDVGKFKGRKNRMLNAPKALFKKAIELDADLYHLHDPELLPIALKLRRVGKVVVFDAHEDFPKQVLSKHYLNTHVAKLISISIKYYENYVCSKLDAVVTATPSIRDKFAKHTKKVVDINNYPLLGELQSINKDWANIVEEIAYVGGISKIRGIQEAVEALSLTKTKTKLNLVGRFSDQQTYSLAQASSGWQYVDELGQLDREQVKRILERSIAGLVTFLPVPNHIDAQPNKMFEYMSAGIPVIGSNYPLWVNIIEGNDCGICVDPENPTAIAQAIDKLVSNKDLAEAMGKNGIKAVNEKYNWAIEEKKLFKLYDELLGTKL
ncbi:glycosyltransferase family 4 protein [Psychrobacter pacificensis]|uniref:glycosyltransferase family 4 protein n=1 Tax=Psychrobacter pacificensis TaxID=112002 RepID=UPI001BAED5ED